jgi:hypothetical protein
MKSAKILFEPWALGDAVIAAATAREAPEELTLACHSKWHALLQAAAPNLRLTAVDLPYSTRDRRSALDLGSPAGRIREDAASLPEVLSIRGDLRDWIAIKRLYPGSRARISGFGPFLTRRSPILDIPYRLGLLPIRNRYRAWAELSGTPFESIQRSYRALKDGRSKDGPILIHLGAQWRSKQFPQVSELLEILRKYQKVLLIAAPHDKLPHGLEQTSVQRVIGQPLTNLFATARCLIANDSGPMHLAAFMGCPTAVVSRASNFAEWAPPEVEVIAAQDMPRGYRPDPRYASDEILEGWPSAAQVADQTTQWLARG